MIQLKQHMYHYDSKQLQPKFLGFALTPNLSLDVDLRVTAGL